MSRDDRGLLPEVRFDGKVMRGKDGWLFIDNDTNEVMRQQRGELLFSADELERWKGVLEKRIAWIAERGASYHFLVPPNPHSVYADKLPFEIPDGTARPVTQLIDYLDSTQSAAHLIYPLADMLERRDSHVYAETGTHWTDLGAFVAYEALMEEIGDRRPVRRLTAQDVTFVENDEPGGLGTKLEPPQSSTHVYGVPVNVEARMTHDNRVFLNGHRIEYECPVAGETTCLVFGDSFAHALLPFLAESFGRLVFAHLITLDRSVVEEVDPDIVVTVMNERFLIRVPDDAGTKTLSECAAEKRATGAVYPPRSTGGNRVDTPTPAWGKKFGG